ncbi:MAG: DNA polymerase III subunit delta' [Clostridia bacterium]|nr:DNA polymerase III subunit delta' [Clostridia bacterium]
MGFTKIYGQKRAVSLLKADFKRGRISHAYLFYGPQGVGKFKTATAFAQLLNCENPIKAEPCGTCLSCRKFSTGNYPDFTVLVPDGLSIKIEQIRALQEKVYFKCYEGKFKVIIIDEAHLMTLQAANSLLKVLEEPPGETVFILLADDLNKLPVTIQSRCQLLSFAYLPEAVISKVLREMGKEVPPALVLAQGSLSKALEMVADLGCQQFWVRMQENFGMLKTGSYYGVFVWAEELAKQRDLIEITLEWLLVLYRNRLVQLTVSEADLVAEVNLNTENISAADFKGCLAALQEINKTVYFLRNNGNRRLALEVLFLKLRKIEQKEKGDCPQ